MRRWNLDWRLLKPTRLQSLYDLVNVPIGKDDIVPIQYELTVTCKRSNPKIVTPVLLQEVAVRLQNIHKLIKINLSRALIPSKRITPPRHCKNIENTERALQIATKIKDQAKFATCHTKQDSAILQSPLHFE